MKTTKERVVIEEPRLARLIFADTRFGWLWLPLRLYLGWAWLEAGWHKFVDPKWMGTGEALLDYWQRGLKMAPKPAIAFDWYRSFIEFLVNAEAHTWFSKIIIFGELLVVRTDSRRIRGRGCLLRWADELEFHHGRIGFNQRAAVCHRDLAGSGMAQRRLDRTGSLAVARDWNAVEAGPSVS